MSFDILQHVDALLPDGGSITTAGDHSFHCPACEAPNFKVNLTTGKWSCFGCDCSSTEQGKRNIRAKLCPPAKPGQPEAAPYNSPAKQRRSKAERHWQYFASGSEDPAITVHRLDDPDRVDGNGWKGGRKIWQTQHLDKGTAPYSEVAGKVRLYREAEALQAIADGAAYVLFLEGEPCVDAAWAIGLPAVCNIGGSGGFKPDRDGPAASGIPSDRLVVCPDRDQIGLKHAAKVAAAYPGCRWLYAFGATAPEWNGACPPDGGLDLADWVRDGATLEEIVASIQADPLPAAEPPAQPPGEAQDSEPERLRAKYKADTRSFLADLTMRIEVAEEAESVAERRAAWTRIPKELGLTSKEFEQLVHIITQPASDNEPQSFEEFVSEMSDDKDPAALAEDIFPVGFILLAAKGHAGKTSLAYQLAEAVTRGEKFAGSFQCQQGSVLIIQCDESKRDAKRKIHKMGLDPEKGAIHWQWNFNSFMFPELRRWIKQNNSRLVILDALVSIAGRGSSEIKSSDPEISFFVYRLNQLAGELGITIILLHHLKKEKASSVVVADDIFGSSYIFNASGDAWGYWSEHKDGRPEPVFSLRCLKVRSGIVKLNETYLFDGNSDDDRLYYQGRLNRTLSLDEERDHRSRVLAFLMSRDGKSFSASQVSRCCSIASARYANHICASLFDNAAKTFIARRKLPSTGGRPAFGYFYAKGSFAGHWDGCSDIHDDDDDLTQGAANGEAPPSPSTADQLLARIRARRKAQEDAASATDA